MPSIGSDHAAIRGLEDFIILSFLHSYYNITVQKSKQQLIISSQQSKMQLIVIEE